MEQYQVSRKTSSLIVLASLMLHLAILIVLFRHANDTVQPTLSKSLFNEDDYMAQDLLSSGQHTATVFFQDDSMADQPVSATDHDEPLPPEQPDTAQHDVTPDIQQPEEPGTTQPPQTALETSTIFEQGHAEQKQVSRKKKSVRKKNAPPKNITFSDISRGFIKSIQQEAGYNKPQQDMRQLALQVYASKVWNLIKNSFLSSENALHLPRAISAHTQLIVAINRSGALVDIQLLYPKHVTDLQQIEHLLINRAKQAGLFPPLPEQIQGEVKRFSFPLFIQAEAGFHSYALSYQ